MDQHEISKSFRFEAAHRLIGVPAGHKCGRLHGHSFQVTLVVRGPLKQPENWVVDYSEIKTAFNPILDQLDHQYLNEIKGLENPTSESIAVWIYEQMKARLPLLYQVIIHETCTTECRYPARN